MTLKKVNTIINIHKFKKFENSTEKSYIYIKESDMNEWIKISI